MCLRKLGCHFPRWRCHIHRFVGKLHRGLFYLISHCIVERGLFLTGILLTQCARLRKALPNAFSKWLPSCKMAAKVCARSGPATATLPRAGGPSPPSPLPAATPERPPYTTATQKGRGKKTQMHDLAPTPWQEWLWCHPDIQVVTVYYLFHMLGRRRFRGKREVKTPLSNHRAVFSTWPNVHQIIL